MGNVDSIPVVSQVKSLVQVIGGDAEGALETQENFAFRNTFPVVSQIASAGYAIGGEPEKARQLQLDFLKATERVVDSVPVVGHVKGAIHFAAGDNARGEEIMKAASRTTGVIGGGVGGFFLGGPAGAVVGGVTGGAAMDGIISGAEAGIHGDQARLQGIPQLVHDAVSGDSRRRPGVGQYFDQTFGVTMDGLAGFGAGNLAGSIKGATAGTAAASQLDSSFQSIQSVSSVNSVNSVASTGSLAGSVPGLSTGSSSVASSFMSHELPPPQSVPPVVTYPATVLDGTGNYMSQIPGKIPQAAAAVDIGTTHMPNPVVTSPMLPKLPQNVASGSAVVLGPSTTTQIMQVTFPTQLDPEILRFVKSTMDIAPTKIYRDTAHFLRPDLTLSSLALDPIVEILKKVVDPDSIFKHFEAPTKLHVFMEDEPGSFSLVTAYQAGQTHTPLVVKMDKSVYNSLRNKSTAISRKSVMEILTTLVNTKEVPTEEEKKAAGRGEHVINNGVLKIYRKIIDRYLNRLGRGSLSQSPEFYGSRTYRQYFQSIESPYDNYISQVMVARVTGMHLDVNSTIYGLSVQLLIETVEELMISAPERQNVLKGEIRVLTKLMDDANVYVDPVALAIWQNQGGDMQIYYESKRKVRDMLFRLGVYHANTPLMWVIELNNWRP